MARLWHNFKEWKNKSMKTTAPELSRSRYSLVSSGDLTPGALELWVGLPEEVKYDPSLESFRQLYEKEHGELETVPLHPKNSSYGKIKRLPLVNSAPHNLHAISDELKEGKPICETIPEQSGVQSKIKDNKNEKWERAKYVTKMTLLVGCWVFFTLVFMLYNEKKEIVKMSSVAPGEVKSYVLDATDERLTMLLKVTGPFMGEQSEKKLNTSQLEEADRMEIWLERWIFSSVEPKQDINAPEVIQKEFSDTWVLALKDNVGDFSEGELRSSRINLEPTNSSINYTCVYSIKIRTTMNTTTPFNMSYKTNPLGVYTGVLYGLLLLFGLYGLIIFEVINRAMAAIIMSTLSLAVLTLAGERPTIPEVISWLDMETLLLLFSMMLLVSILAETGMFDSLAVFAFQVTKGKIWPLIILLCATTALVSTFLDNVTTVLLMAPVTIRLCEVTGLDPVPILMSMVLYSNIGGTATPVGDPPNLIISSHKLVVQAGINFTNFTLHMSLGILLVCVQTYLQLKYMHIDTKKLRHSVPSQINDLRQQISIWRRAADSLPHLSKDEQVVKARLENKIQKLNLKLDLMLQESNKRACPKDTFPTTLSQLKSKYKIRDKMLLLKASFATAFVIIVFFLHSIPELNRISLGWTALLGAILLLILVDREDIEPILHRVEWSTLLFFASLFILMEALSKLGFIDFIGGATESVILSVHEDGRLAVAILLILWVSGLTLAFLDNIPLTTMMVRVVTSLGTNPKLNIPLPPLIWALSFGACLGGNGTLIGASANVVCAGIAEQHGYKFTFLEFFKIGFPVMIGHLLTITAYLLICHCVFEWHL